MVVVPGDLQKNGISGWFRECLLWLMAKIALGEHSSASILED